MHPTLCCFFLRLVLFDFIQRTHFKVSRLHLWKQDVMTNQTIISKSDKHNYVGLNPENAYAAMYQLPLNECAVAASFLILYCPNGFEFEKELLIHVHFLISNSEFAYIDQIMRGWLIDYY